MTTPNPLVSIVIPARLDTPEKLAFFHEALASADTQSYMRPYEICVCLDGSPLPDPPRTNTPIRWSFHKVARGAGAARNTAARGARGTYLLPLDADDVLPVYALDMLIECADPSLFVYGDVELFGERGGVFRLPPYQQHEMLKLTGLAPVTALFSRAAWLKAGGWDETLTALEDVDFYLRLIEAGYSGLHLDQTTLRYRKHVNSRQATAESGKDTLRGIQETIRNNHKSLYNGDDTDMPCSTCPGQGTVATGVPMPDPNLQSPIELRYEGPMQGSFDLRSHRDANIVYQIPGRGGTFWIDGRDLQQFEGRTVYGAQEYRNLTAMQQQHKVKPGQQAPPEVTASARLNIPPLPHLPHLETMNFTQAKAAIDEVHDAADLRALYAEESALPEPRKTVLAHIQKRLNAAESEMV